MSLDKNYTNRIVDMLGVYLNEPFNVKKSNEITNYCSKEDVKPDEKFMFSYSHTAPSASPALSPQTSESMFLFAVSYRFLIPAFLLPQIPAAPARQSALLLHQGHAKN